MHTRRAFILAKNACYILHVSRVCRFVFCTTSSTNYVKESFEKWAKINTNDNINWRTTEQDDNRWSSYIIELLFSTKLNEWGLQRMARRRSNVTLGGPGYTILMKKKWNQNTKSSPKFGRATYTIEIVTIKERYSFDIMFIV